MADQTIDFDVRKALGDIAQLKGGLADLQKQVSSTESAWDKAFGVGEAREAVAVLNSLEKEFEQLKKDADTLRNAMKGATDPAIVKSYAENIAKLEKGMENLAAAGKSVGVNLEKANKSAGTGKQVFENFFGAFTKVTLIIAAIEAVAKFVSYATNLSGEIRKASKSFEAFTGDAAAAEKIVGSLLETANKNFLPTDEVLAAGKALLAFGESADNLPDVLGRIADVSAATGKNFGELATLYGKARTAGVLYAEDINQLVDAGIPIIQEFAKQMGVSNDAVKKLASEGKISFEELQLAMFNLTAQGGKFADQAQAGADSIGGAWTKLLATIQPVTEKIGGFFEDLVKGGIYILQDLADAVKGIFSDAVPEPANVELIDKEAMYADRREYEKELNTRAMLEKEAAEARKRRNKQSVADAEKAAKDLARLRIEAMKEGEAREIAAENLRFEELKKQLLRYHLDTEQAEQQHQINVAEIIGKFGQQRAQEEYALLEMRRAQAEYEAEIAKSSVDAERKRAEGQKAVRDSELDILEAYFDNFIRAMEANGASREQVAEQQAAFDKQIKEERLKAEIAFQEAMLATMSGGDEKLIEAAKNNLTKLKAQLEGLSISGPSGGGPQSAKDYLKSLFGFSDEQISELGKAVGTVSDLLRQNAQAAVEQADARVQAARQVTDAAQEYYDEQKALQEQGFASDVDLAKRRLEAAKAQEQQALEQKRKAQKQQILLDTALQASNLITAAAQTLKTFNGPLLPLGIALVAAMFGAFFAAKAKAINATKFKHGGEGRVNGDGIIVGPSHEGGGVAIEAEGGELFASDGKRFGIVNKRMTSKHFDLLRAVNKDDKTAMRSALEKIVGSQSVDRGAVLGGQSGSAISVRESEIVPLLKEWRKESGTTVSQEGRYTVIRKKGYTRRILN